MTQYILSAQDRAPGINAYRDNILRLLDEASTCQDFLGARSHALGLYLLAVEECGSSLLLKDTLTFDDGDHRKKVQTALRVLPDACKEFYLGVRREDASATSENVSFKKGEEAVLITEAATGSFTTAVLIDATVRHEAMYVKWDPDNGRWEQPVVADLDELQKAIEELRKFVQDNL